ncbi:diacylglycerol kinase theta [Diaphorina citri]|uniref:Diacylglycerol kinase n=1 Tax=Diaphorina citri TaxID=121845 RepID=A0A3Q0J6R1_DIACI|nr:diacylglycerol kinase theta [Diaphorina citri]
MFLHLSDNATAKGSSTPRSPPPTSPGSASSKSGRSASSYEGRSPKRSPKRSPGKSPRSLEQVNLAPLQSFPPELLRLVDRVGQGQFAQLELCEVTQYPEWMEEHCKNCKLVIRKSLRHNVPAPVRWMFVDRFPIAENLVFYLTTNFHPFGCVSVCNFVVHDRCLKTVVSACSSIAANLIKNPVAHCWSEQSHHKRKFCNVCRKRLDESGYGTHCEICEYFVHAECQDFAVADCKENATYVPGKELAEVHHEHHWREGNLPSNSKCAVCKKTCWSAECLAGYRCEWCGTTCHAACKKNIPVECNFGNLEPIYLPPHAVSIPRTEVPMEAIIGVQIRRKDTMSPRSISEEFSSGESRHRDSEDNAASSSSHSKDKGAKEKEDRDEETIKVYDGNLSVRRRIFRPITVSRLASLEHILTCALRAFHITKNPENFFLTDLYSPNCEAVLADPSPIMSLTRQEGKRPAVYLRFKDNSSGEVRVYGGKLQTPTPYSIVPVNDDTSIADLIRDALKRFGFEERSPEDYRLSEILLDRGVMLLPNIEPSMTPPGVQPLLVFVNVKSGGCQGLELISNFRKLLNPYQVFDLDNGGPLPGLYVFRHIQDYKILVCGGDGTIGWVLQCLDNVGQDSECSSPPCAIVPLGTGNDLARVLRWGSGLTGGEDPLSLLRDVIEAEEIRLDRWTVVFHPEDKEEKNQVLNSNTGGSEDNTQILVMNNYFGIGIDADLCLDFHNAREENPNKFKSRIHNKGVYVKMGLYKMIGRKMCKDLHREIRLEVDGKHVELPPVEGIIILNILSWGSGANPWGPDKEDQFSTPNHWDETGFLRQNRMKKMVCLVL